MPQANTKRITPTLSRALPLAVLEKVESAIEHHLEAVSAFTAFLDHADGARSRRRRRPRRFAWRPLKRKGR
jgi:hypothetical protein